VFELVTTLETLRDFAINTLSADLGLVWELQKIEYSNKFGS
jgi:hypothetical protein